jgi:antitoxin CptB
MNKIENLQILRAKAKFESRRGMLELDVFLRPFVERYADEWGYSELMQYLQFLEAPDPDLFAWLMGYETPPKEFHHLVQSIRIFRQHDG